MNKTIISRQNFDRERALYGEANITVCECTFAGEADGESALKECNHICVDRCTFALRYPFWHTASFCMQQSTMTESCRAPIWYAKEGQIEDSVLHGVKAVRECEDISFARCDIQSPEFGWKCRGLSFSHCQITSEYFLLDSCDICLRDVEMTGKYSFQYVKNATVENCVLNTKDAFWHSENITVKNSTVRGEYLGWYSHGLTLENCHIIGTQPLCYCTDLTLINCTTEGCDLAFERSHVTADIKGDILSVKNPLSGKILSDGYGEIINDGTVDSCCEIAVR